MRMKWKQRWDKRNGSWYLRIPEGSFTVTRVKTRVFHVGFKPLCGAYENLGTFSNLEVAKNTCQRRLLDLTSSPDQ
jgi:hypothetical protein